MIVSGFTQRRSHLKQPDVVNIPGQHSHCVHCCQANCPKFVDNISVCAVVTCQACGWRSHECKLSEHALMCPEERVSCLNKEYGCPHMLKRSKIASHLAVCPASVVFCAEEWSRWPMHAREQGVRMPLPQEKNYLDCGQLDVGLAMRDQRMLIDSLRAPRKLRQTLRNPLTQIYPAAPFPNWRRSFDSDPAVSGDTSQTVSEDDADAPWDLSKTHPGLKESIRSRLFRVSKETADSLAAALEITSNALSSSQLSEISGAGDSNLQMVADARSAKCDSLAKSITSMESNESAGSCMSWPGQVSPSASAGSLIVKGSSNGLSADVKGSSNGLNVEESLKLSEMAQGASPSVEHLDRRSQSSDRCSDISTRSKSTLHDFGGRQLHRLIGYKPEEGQAEEICLHKVLGVSINIECINKYVTKPASMYTFICAQNFRRDEYHWHFKNVHLDIHTGLSGWLEQRCPLANLGCTFSCQRLQPQQPDMVIHHSWLQESFGLRSIVQPGRKRDDNPSVTSTYSTDSALSPVAKFTSDVKFSQTAQKHMPHLKGQNHIGITDTASLAPASLAVNSWSPLDKDASLPQPVEPDNCSNVNNSNLNTVDKIISLDHQHSQTQGDPGVLQSLHPEERDGHSESNFMKVQPIIYTASNWDSKVLFQYDMEAESDEDLAEVTDIYHNIINLPFEVLRHIARHLDSFSLCNLSLTCHVLRDVCCSLLDECGIVLLNWHRERSEVNSRVSWKVSGKRWMFSTSFEPIHFWKFTENHLTIGEHLKVCPYNKDVIRHTKFTSCCSGLVEKLQEQRTKAQKGSYQTTESSTETDKEVESALEPKTAEASTSSSHTDKEEESALEPKIAEASTSSSHTDKDEESALEPKTAEASTSSSHTDKEEESALEPKTAETSTSSSQPETSATYVENRHTNEARFDPDRALESSSSNQQH